MDLSLSHSDCQRIMVMHKCHQVEIVADHFKIKILLRKRAPVDLFKDSEFPKLADLQKDVIDYLSNQCPNEQTHGISEILFRRTQNERAADLTKILPQLETLSSMSLKLGIKAKGRILFIDPADIAVVEAEGKYVLLRRNSGTCLLRLSISTIADKFKPYGFLRIHRSVLVNASFVEEIRPRNSGEYLLRIKGGKEYRVSRTYKNNLRSIAHSWIGTKSFIEG